MPVITVKPQETGITDNSDTSASEVPAATSNANKSASPFSQKWTSIVNRLRAPVLTGLHKITNLSAQHPKTVLLTVAILSLTLFVIGLFTGFSVEVDEDRLWTPAGSKPLQHSDWIDDESGFPIRPRTFLMVFHQDGSKDILTQPQVERIFEAVDTVRNLPDYDSVCARSPDGVCDLHGVTKFWNNTASIFASQVTSDEDAVAAMSALTFPDDSTPVVLTDIMGNAVRDPNSMLLTEAQSYVVTIELPEDDEDKDETITEDFEKEALDAILALDEEWQANTAFRVEVIADRSFEDEFERAIVADIPLIPIVFVLMGLFTSFIFYKRDKVLSRSLLGFTAVLSVLLSIVAGYGLMFVCFVPFTSMTQILPFVFFGVGLDDSFIITGSFFRTDPRKEIEDRVRETVDDIGLSVFLTTLTSSLAFGLGCLSNIPAVYYLCLYAVPTIVLILLWQLTFFMSCLVLDERRVAANNRDCLRCCSSRTTEPSPEDTNAEQQQHQQSSVSRIDSWMECYAEKLLRPWVKVAVIASFMAIAAACAVSASNLKQSFEFTDVLPADSYITDFFDAFDEYSARSSVIPQAYFRFVDQSDEQIQDQMEKYVNDLVEIEAIDGQQPSLFWLRDFRSFVADEGLTGDTFNAQVDAFLSNPAFGELYSDHIVRGADGTITASRVAIPMDNVDIQDVREQIDALEDQRRVSEAQPVNQGQSEFRFFTYESTYNIWEFYAASANELVFTTVSGVCAVTGVTFLLVPHWTAALFVLPLISVLYIDLLGVMQWSNVSVNPVSYISLVMSIGLLVDFILHVLLRYYESPGTSRKEKVVETMRTMGSSILIGAVTTLLGTVPLAFSTSDIFHTVFIAFLGLVVLGGTHGLILLPVILSILGPEEKVVLNIAAPRVPSTSSETQKAANESMEEEADGLVDEEISV